jgi:Na+/proline symporter
MRLHIDARWKIWKSDRLLGALWAPVIGRFSSIWIYLQTIQVYLMMPFAGIFFAGVLWKRTTTTGVIACLATSCVVCPLLMANGQAHFLPFMEHPLLRPWLHAAFVSFLVCMVVLVGVSMVTMPTPAEKLANTTVTEWRALLTADKVPLHRNYLFWLSLLLVTCATLWFIMR